MSNTIEAAGRGLAATIACAALLGWSAAIPAHPHGHDHGHGPHHKHAPHDYSYADDAGSYTAPEPDEDGYYWWRGNLHTHSLWSDGDQFPEVIVDWYVQHGYHFLAMSDHNVLSQGERWIDPATNSYILRSGGRQIVDLYLERFEGWAETRDNEGTYEVRLKPLNEFRHLFEQAGRFILIQAEEITEREHNVHTNAANVIELIEPITGENVADTIRQNIGAVHEQSARYGQPMLPHLNHPNWQWAVRAEDMVPVENLKFFEVYNGHRGVANYGDDLHASLERMWDIVLTRRLAEEDLGIVYGLAVDDAHNYETSRSETARPGRGWVKVRARYLTPEHLIGAMESGDFYASTGVTLKRIERGDKALRIEIQGEPDVTYTTRFIGTRKGYDPSRAPRLDEDGEPLNVTKRYSDDIGAVLKEVEGTEAVYEFDGDEIYVRATIESSKPKENPFAEGELETAWVQPVQP